MRDHCQFNEGSKVDIIMEDNTIMILPSVTARTRMDNNFDSVRQLLQDNNITLEVALAKLLEIKQAE